MVYFPFSRRLVWFFSALVYFSSSVALSSRVSASEKYSRHDKNWWFWNQEAKEKQDESRRKGENGIQNLDFTKSVHPLNTDPLRFFSEEPPSYHKVKKRWLPGAFGLRGRKKQHKEPQKWLIDSQRSGVNSLSTIPVFQYPWMMSHKRMQVISKDSQNDTVLRKYSARHRFNATDRQHGIHLKKIASQQGYAKKHAETNPESILFRSSNHAYNNRNGLESMTHGRQEVKRFPGQRYRTYASPAPSSKYQRLWDKSYEPVWDTYMTHFKELKFNPSTHPYPFHDPRSSVKWYTTPYYGQVKTSGPPLDGPAVDNERQLTASAEDEDKDAGKVILSKGVAKSKHKKIKEAQGQRRSHSEYELVPKVYALNQIRNGEKSNTRYNEPYGWFENSITNPIFVPGFERKQTEAPDDEYVSIRPYGIRTEERNAPFDDEFIQVSRANRNQTKTASNINDSSRATANGTPIQLASPYAFPGGVNISILVPNPPAPYSRETPMPTSSDKHAKKKKERKQKGKNEDELRENLISEPKSLAPACVNRKFPYAEKTGVNPLIGNDDRRINGIRLLNYRPQMDNTIGDMRHPIFDLKPDNFSLLSHFRNLTLGLGDQLFGMQNEEVKKPFEESEGEEEDEEGRMLYDEKISSSTTLRSDEKQPYGYGQTASFSWCRSTDYAQRTPDARGGWAGFSTPSDDRLRGFVFGGSGSGTLGGNNYLNSVTYIPKRIDPWTGESRKPFGRSLRGAGTDKRETEAIRLKKCKSQMSNSNRQNYHKDVLRGEAKDQWDALDEDLKSEMSGNVKMVVWQARNRKREADYDSHQMDDEQGYYRLSDGGNSLRNPTKLILSAFKSKPNEHREREYYDEISEERHRGQVRPNDVAPSSYPT